MMFPSSYNNSSGTYPCYPSSSSYPLFPFLNPENASSSNNTLLHDPLVVNVPYNIPTHHHHHNTHQIQETLTNNLPLSDAAAMHPKQDINIASHYGSISCLLTKKPAKKDRHSKIYTSQGLRDRRVRLSIEIARKFFDLQDMLGFDKASNTLEWLFNKSKKAIKDLARSKNSISKGSKSFSSSSSDCEEEDFEVVSNDALNLQQGLDCSDVVKERKMKRAQKELPACNVRAKMKESREKARARARERTSNKMCNNGRVQVQDLKKKCLANANHENPPQILHQLRSPLPVEDCARSSPNKMVQPHQPHHHLVMSSEGTRDDFNVIEESIVIKRKLKPSLMSSSHHHHHHHQNLVIPKEASFNNNNSTDNYQPFPNLSPNWDANNGANNATGRSNFCAIASMNLSTGLQIFGKSWE